MRKLRLKSDKEVHSSTLSRREFLKATGVALASTGTARTAEDLERGSADGVAALVPGRLCCEYFNNPLGIDVLDPRLGWVLESTDPTARGQRQTAYQILVATRKETLDAGRGDLWDSGKVNSGQSAPVVYSGKRLRSGQRCHWKVRVWDERGRVSLWSRAAVWEMGLLKSTDWKANWISAPGSFLPLMRKEFTLNREPQSARLYVCGLGQYELWINGSKIGDQVLAPGWTDYRQTCFVNTFDVTEALRIGGNAMGVALGNGMYNVTRERYAKFTGSFGPLVLILQLNLTFGDGSTQRIVSDGTWKCAASPTTFSSIYGGEDYDARAEQPGWDRPGFSEDERWKSVSHRWLPWGILKAQMNPPIKVKNTFTPARVSEPKPRVYVYDLGQNFSGWPEIAVRGPAGARVTMTPAEILKDGLADQSTMGGGPISFSYTLKGSGTEVWHPRFSYTGFRYVQVEGAAPAGTSDANASSDVPVLDRIEGQMVHADVETVGSFSCSNTLFNRTHEIINWAILSNTQSVFTDCPHREKLGWLEQTHLMGPSIMFNYDVAALYTKVISDMGQAQRSNGLVPDIAPEFTVFPGAFRDAPAWGSASVIDPWFVYTIYGDTRVLREHFAGMKRYVEYLMRQADGYLLSYGLGDWGDVGPLKNHWAPQNTPVALTSTAILYYDVKILAWTAKVIGKKEDEQKYSRMAERIRRAFNRAFFNPRTNQYATGSQTSNGMPLALGLAGESRAPGVLQNLIRDIRAHGYHTTAGDVGHRFVLLALLQGGRSDVIFEMTRQTTGPSYGYQVEHGATTLTEAWDGPTIGYSQNHLMLGHIEEWFYAGLAGIRDVAGSTGFQKIIIQPQVAGDLDYVRASYRSVRGVIKSEWEIKGDQLHLAVAIPANATAEVYVPARSVGGVTENDQPARRSRGVRFLRMEKGCAVFGVGSGSYHFITRHARSEPGP